jgi:hypothetical protein
MFTGPLNVIRAGHVISALIADQLAPARFKPLRAHRTIAQSILPLQLGSDSSPGTLRGHHSGLQSGILCFGPLSRLCSLHTVLHSG